MFTKFINGTFNQVTMAAALRRSNTYSPNAPAEEKKAFRVGIPFTKRIREVARLTVQRMDEAMAAGHGKSAFKDYKQAIERYLIPFFGSTAIENIDIPKLQQFEVWRVEKMEKAPAASTVLNHNAALHRVFDTAISEGWIKEQQLPTLRTVGKKSQRRPHFTLQEWEKLTEHLQHWPDKTPYPKSRLMRELMGDYALILANTGIRPGKEALNLKWSQIRWHSGDDGQRYLALTVNGKTGKRELIARHGCLEYLKRLQSRFPDIAKLTFDELLTAKIDQFVFRLRSGKQTKNMGHIVAAHDGSTNRSVSDVDQFTQRKWSRFYSFDGSDKFTDVANLDDVRDRVWYLAKQSVLFQRVHGELNVTLH